MAVAPKFAATRLVFGTPAANISGVPPATHTLEVFLDYCCPFSAKIFRTLTSSVVPLIKASPSLAPNVQLIFRQQVQPWHPSSTLMHEAALAVQRVAPECFWEFSGKLFDAQTSYFDVSLVNETRNQTYKRLAALAGEAGVNADKVYELLEIPSEARDGALNVGNGVTNDLKHAVKTARLVGVHVSPTVIFDGVVQNDVSSSWTLEQWEKWLNANVV
ncbi:hypothetical protein TD95_000055 [Thielaviopsis punctulata]|uniref:Uncharacterized protein n=1 Tax=Thielaviopsis punctulata TaxID=72032 RepID=A0A0F4Z6P0_9PEZI|nr:hypothetical protein TD95_000055 [Thielaviopsis punctulata]